MAAPRDPQTSGSTANPSSRSSKASLPKTDYLVLYNFISAVLWLLILTRVILVVSVEGYGETYNDIGNFAKWTQTLAVLEIIHAAIGVVTSPIFTTFAQVYSRLFIFWGVVDMFPHVAKSPAYSSMLLAYGFTEVIRYSYFVFNLSGYLPGFVNWLRYSTFYVLYPLGISSEFWLMYKSLKPAQDYQRAYGLFILLMLIIWPIGAYIMISHMMAQRWKVMKGKHKKSN